MKVFKFGGASLKNAQAVRNMSAIVLDYAEGPLLVVVSAMDKTTNALEQVVRNFLKGVNYKSGISNIFGYHQTLVNELFENPKEILTILDGLASQLTEKLHIPGDEDKLYDQVVCFGEILSSVIVHHYLATMGIKNTWKDARQLICTDSTYREGKIVWALTESNIISLKQELVKMTLFKCYRVEASVLKN